MVNQDRAVINEDNAVQQNASRAVDTCRESGTSFAFSACHTGAGQRQVLCHAPSCREMTDDNQVQQRCANIVRLLLLLLLDCGSFVEKILHRCIVASVLIQCSVSYAACVSSAYRASLLRKQQCCRPVV